MAQENNVSVMPAFNLTHDTVHTGLVIRQIDKTNLTMPLMGIPHTHNFYTLSVLAQGTMTLYTDYQQIQVQAPALLLLGKDQVHAHNTYQQVVMTSLSFTDWFTIDTNSDWPSLFTVPALPITNHDFSQITEYTRLLEREHETNNQLNNNHIANHLLTIIIQLALQLKHKYQTSHTHPSSTLYQRFNQLLNQQYRSVSDSKTYAYQLCVTEQQLKAATKYATGKGPKQLINERQLLETKRLLYWADWSIKEIAWQLGFTSEQYFSRFFKKHTDYTPSRFQKLFGHMYK